MWLLEGGAVGLVGRYWHWVGDVVWGWMDKGCRQGRREGDVPFVLCMYREWGRIGVVMRGEMPGGCLVLFSYCNPSIMRS